MKYYRENFESFIKETIDCDMSEQYRLFEKYLEITGKILDVGFGSGRDSLYFKSKGYEVYSIDPEPCFVEHAFQLKLSNVFQMRVQDMTFVNMFDGIWACASLLHTPSNELGHVFNVCAAALKTNGIIYASFKYGDFEGERNGRFYIDLNEKTVNRFLDTKVLELLETHISFDVRPDKSEKWINIILRKK